MQTFETFECSGQNSSNSSCHFPNNRLVFLQILHHSSVSWKITPLYFYRSNIIYFAQKENFWDFRELGSKFTKFLPILKQRIVFLQILHHSLMSWDTTPLCFFSWNFIYFQQKELIKVQIWWNFMRAVESLKFCSLMFSFCLIHIKFLLKRYRKVVSPDTGEWWKVFLKSWLVISKWHEEFGVFSLNHSKVRKFHFDGPFLSKEYSVWAKKYRGVVFHDTEQWHKTWINPDLVVSN